MKDPKVKRVLFHRGLDVEKEVEAAVQVEMVVAIASCRWEYQVSEATSLFLFRYPVNDCYVCQRAPMSAMDLGSLSARG